MVLPFIIEVFSHYVGSVLMRKLLFLFCLCLLSFNINAPIPELTLEKGVTVHKEIDAVYAQFSEAYRTLDIEKVTNLYSENAAYLAPNQEIQQGHAQIREGFKNFFDWVKDEKRTMTISFQIFQRKVEEKMGYDVGIYTIRQFKDGKEAGKSQGKFIVVAIKETSGKWRFQVDGYSDLKPQNKD